MKLDPWTQVQVIYLLICHVSFQVEDNCRLKEHQVNKCKTIPLLLKTLILSHLTNYREKSQVTFYRKQMAPQQSEAEKLILC